MSLSRAQRLGGVRRFAALALTSLVAIVGVQSTLGPAHAASIAPMARATSAAAASYEGCPSGYLCLYKGSYYNNHNFRPDAKYYACGIVNLSGWVTHHGSYVNNQTGGVTSKFWSGYNGTGRVLRYSRSVPHSGWYDPDFDFYPVNSITVC
jgi:hypothetical protein